VEYEQSAPGPIFWIICIAVAVFYIATMWKVLEKAGKPGWASIIPIYNTIVLLQIAGRPIWFRVGPRAAQLYFLPDSRVGGLAVPRAAAARLTSKRAPNFAASFGPSPFPSCLKNT